MAKRSRSPVERAVRTSSRIALYVSLAVTALAGLALARFARPPHDAVEAARLSQLQSWTEKDYTQFEDVRLLAEYVRINTSYPDPDEVAGARFLAARLEAAGIPATIEVLGERDANLWAFVEGRDPRAIVLHGHLDVEEALGQEGWRFPPYAAHIEGPWMFGRGIYDMKSLTIAQLLALVELKKSGRPLARSVLFLATSGEEKGSDLGTRWILARHPELVARMGLVLTEGGVVEATSPQDVKYWGIEFGQKTFADVEFCSASRENLVELRRVLADRIAERPPDPPLSRPVEIFLDQYGPSREFRPFQRLLADPQRVFASYADFMTLSPFLRSLFRSEIVPFAVEADPTGGFRLPAKLHLLPGADAETTVADLLPAWLRHGVTVRLGELEGSRGFTPVDTPDFRTIAAVVAEAHPGIPVGPYFGQWAGSDARFFRAAGIATYGFSPFLISVTDTMQIALPNERMPLPGFRSGVELYRTVLARLAE
ncbi:MAG: M20/M25/M40 family metallo-hydrolase [Thermoanaerobaculia bacterium]